jgi:pyridoxamine 5'-phosphate oxidase
MTSLADLRKSYSRGALAETDVAPDPVVQFDKWFAEALAAQIPEPNAMTLATVDADGQPSARIVLIKGMDARGVVFFTNYDSRKGRALASEPRAALLFHWIELERQVRLEGVVEKTSEAESDAYFASRPLGSRLGAWSSPQSAVVAGRAELEAREARMRERFGDAPSRPPHWGGYRLKPAMFEFWQGRESRMHDRIRYCRTASDDWKIERLAP